MCIMAYGQTGSGKTFTMMGPANNMGVNRRAIRELLTLCQKSTDIDYVIKVSLMEVYNEKIFDLLTGDRSKSLEVHQMPSGSVYVADLVEEQVFTAEDVESVLARGDAHRSVASTSMNTDSSRSHLLMQLTVSGFNKISKVTTSGKLTLVDLAGSERVAKSEVTGARLMEAAAINKSLSALGQVCPTPIDCCVVSCRRRVYLSCSESGLISRCSKRLHRTRRISRTATPS